MFLAEGLLYLEVRITEGEFCQYFWGVWKDKSVYMGLKRGIGNYLEIN